MDPGGSMSFPLPLKQPTLTSGLRTGLPSPTSLEVGFRFRTAGQLFGADVVLRLTYLAFDYGDVCQEYGLALDDRDVCQEYNNIMAVDDESEERPNVRIQYAGQVNIYPPESSAARVDAGRSRHVELAARVDLAALVDALGHLVLVKDDNRGVVLVRMRDAGHIREAMSEAVLGGVLAGSAVGITSVAHCVADDGSPAVVRHACTCTCGLRGVRSF